MRLNEIYQSYSKDVEFYVIYIREAHAADGWVTPQNLYDEVNFNEPTTDEERAEVASACQTGMDLQMPMLIDSIDNAVDDAYIAEPIRLYVIDREGVISYNGAQGPAGFDPESWAEAIEEQIAAG